MITGINGFVGKHLARELHGRKLNIIGVGRDVSVSPEIAKMVSRYFQCDLTNENDVSKLPLGELDAVVSLAGLAKVGESFDEPELYNHVNVAVLSVLGAKLKAIKSTARVIAVSTGAIYDSHQPMPLSEGSKIITTGSPYALSKIAMEQEAMRLVGLGLDCVIVRPFNHIGPGQEDGFLVPDLYAKIQTAIKTGGKLEVGDLTTKRDYTDVRDVVRAYADLVLAPKLNYPIYNVCSGHSVSGDNLLELLVKEMGQTEQIQVVINPDLVRPNDPKDLYGNNERLCTETSWRPIIELEQTIRDFVSNS